MKNALIKIFIPLPLKELLPEKPLAADDTAGLAAGNRTSLVAGELVALVANETVLATGDQAVLLELS